MRYPTTPSQDILHESLAQLSRIRGEVAGKRWMIKSQSAIRLDHPQGPPIPSGVAPLYDTMKNPINPSRPDTFAQIPSQ